jgi:hypothetical protein
MLGKSSRTQNQQNTLVTEVFNSIKVIWKWKFAEFENQLDNNFSIPLRRPAPGRDGETHQEAGAKTDREGSATLVAMVADRCGATSRNRWWIKEGPRSNAGQAVPGAPQKNLKETKTAGVPETLVLITDEEYNVTHIVITFRVSKKFNLVLIYYGKGKTKKSSFQVNLVLLGFQTNDALDNDFSYILTTC